MARTVELLKKHHNHDITENQCSSYLIRQIKAPVDLVWSLIGRFDQPQTYKSSITNCDLQGAGCSFTIRSIREVKVQSEVSESKITERLEILDEEERVFGVRIIGGDVGMRRNYASIVSVHTEIVDGLSKTLVVESYVVDVADGTRSENLMIK